MIVVFDGELGSGARRGTDPAYKAHRPGGEAALAPIKALPDVKSGLDALKISWIEIEDAEDADVIATSVSRVPAGPHVLIMSGDRDMHQLVTNRVLVLNTAMRPGQRLIGPKHIEARYGVPPIAWCCRAGLAGDPSDGIKGIPGIGSVTAARLLHGGLRLEDLPASGRTGQRVLDNMATAIRCRDLARMRTDSPSRTFQTAGRPLCCPRPPTSSRCWTCGDNRSSSAGLLGPGGLKAAVVSSLETRLYDGGLQRVTSEHDGRERTRQHERPEWQLAGAARPVRGDERAAAHGSQRKPEERAGEQCLPARPAEHEAEARGQLGVAKADPARPDQQQGQVEAGEGGSADRGAGEIAGLMAGQRGCGQQGERPSERGGGQRVREPVHGDVDKGERDGYEGQPGQCCQFPGRSRAGGHDGQGKPGRELGEQRVRADPGPAGRAAPGDRQHRPPSPAARQDLI
jgi:DNA polymerase I